MTDDPGLRVDFTTDPGRFLDAAEAHLAADPVVTTVVATVTSRYRDLRAGGEPAPAAAAQQVLSDISSGKAT